MEKVESLVLKNLLFNEEYARKVIPFIKKEYFEDQSNQVLFEEITSFIVKYDELPSKEAVSIEVENREDLTDTLFKELSKVLSYLEKEPTDFEWVLDTTERWCRDRAIYLALMESIALADGKDEKKGRDAIPSILSDALAVSFDNHVGHNYLEDYEERYALYHRKEDKIPFDLEYLNKITKGGLPNKTLNIALAGTGVGKSLFMCHVASAALMQGRNVLYITCEMAEEKIAERIDANLLNVNIQDIVDLPKQMFDNKVNNIAKKTQGNLIIKEYPTASAHAGHFRSLLNELALKKSFRPDIIFVDYLNICASSRYKGSANINSYTLVKSIAEELRGLAVEANVPIVSATQTTRSGYCLDLKTQVQTPQGLKDISNIQVGDLVLSNTGYNEVLDVFPKTKKKSYKITLEDGKEIICSEEHLFPTENGELNIKGGLEEGMCLYVREFGGKVEYK